MGFCLTYFIIKLTKLILHLRNNEVNIYNLTILHLNYKNNEMNIYTLFSIILMGLYFIAVRVMK